MLHKAVYWSTDIAQIISNAGNRTSVMKLLDNFFLKAEFSYPRWISAKPTRIVSLLLCNKHLQYYPPRILELVFTWKTILKIIFTQISETGTTIQFHLRGTRTTNLVWYKHYFLYILHFPGWNSKHCSCPTFLKQLELIKQNVR